MKLAVVAIVALACLAISSSAFDKDERGLASQPFAPPIPTDPFSPSNARTQDGNFIPEAQFFPAERCASCHKDTHGGWAQSLHRNAGREPFYKESVDILVRTRGIEFTRHCESCHAPTALFSGALTTGSKESRAMDDEGVTCTVCHSITEARLDGTGSYTIRRPALLAREDGTPVFGDVSNEQIMADVPGHRRAVMRPLLKKPEFCAVCHKSSAPPELNGYKFIRGFSAYDEWQQSGASHETVTPFYRRAKRTDCNACHMPRVSAANDLAAKNGSIASHRWLGANTAAPLFYGQSEQVEMTERFLKENVLSVDIFSIKREATGEQVAPLSPEQTIELKAGEEITAEVVVANRNAAHSFPPELRDLYEAWVEFEAIDGSGRTIFHSGYLNPDKTLDESAHVYKAVLLDESGRHITRHQVWVATVKAYDNAIPPGRSDVVRFRFRAPAEAGQGAQRRITLRARVNYRRFVQEYTDFVLGKQKSQLTVPVVRMAEAVAVVRDQLAQMAQDAHSDRADALARRAGPGVRGRSPKYEVQSKASDTRLGIEEAKLAPGPRPLTPAPQARRWNDYGIGLLEQAQYGAAARAFRRASELDPTDVNLMVNAAIAEMKTERFGPEREQLTKAAALLDCALKVDPSHARARFYWALLLRARGKAHEAADELRRIAAQYPRDREVQRQLGQTLYGINDLVGARAAFEALIAIDPTDAGAYQFLAPLYSSEGRKAEAERARSLYLQWRDDPRADGVAARFFSAHPEWAEERVGLHVHGKDSQRRPVLTGPLAAPDN